MKARPGAPSPQGPMAVDAAAAGTQQGNAMNLSTFIQVHMDTILAE
jgi:hypothetical protein